MSLSEIRDRIFLARDYDELLGHVSLGIQEVTGGNLSCCRLHLIHPDSPEVRLAVSRGSQRDTSREVLVPSAKSTLGEYCLRLDQPKILSENLREILKDFPSSFNGPDPKMVVAIPLRLNGKNQGAVFCEFDTKPPEMVRRLDELQESLNILTAASSEVLGCCNTVERIRRQRNDLQEAFEAATLLDGGEDLLSIGQGAADIASERLGFDRVNLFRYIPLRLSLEGIGSTGFQKRHDGQVLSLDEDRNLFVQSFKDAVPVWWERKEAPVPDEEEFAPQTGWHAVCLPLLAAEGRPVGILYGDHLENRAQVTKERLAALQLFADNVARRIESASLLSEVGRLADQDGLTEIANRRSFDKHLRREVARAIRFSLPLSLLMIDIDRFKYLNDKYGHLTGDEVLIATARLLESSIRETDFVARYGGDEFVVLMPNTTEEQGCSLRDRIEENLALAAPRFNREGWQFRLSIGMRSAVAEEAGDLLESADKALYAHKTVQVRRYLLQQIVMLDEESLLQWDHYLAKILRVLTEKESYNFDHSRRVMNLCVALARALKLSKEETEVVALSAMLHDVGKISIPTSLLQRAGPLTPQEYRLIQTHPKAGDDLLEEVKHLGEVGDIVRYHHERWDGLAEGRFPAYPAEVKGEEIPLAARILKVADCYDAMVSFRPYKTPKSPQEALAEMENNAGKMFDPEIVRILKEWIDTVSSQRLEGELASYEM